MGSIEKALEEREGWGGEVEGDWARVTSIARGDVWVHGVFEVGTLYIQVCVPRSAYGLMCTVYCVPLCELTDLHRGWCNGTVALTNVG